MAIPQINLYFTDEANENTDDDALQDDCLYVSLSNNNESFQEQITRYCLSESSRKFSIETNHMNFPSFTSDELAKNKITSKQLYI
ncbi:hypothetical protein I4U23_021975 [Adineta vaga]|nr:hypothetical protein I4U23_021975 [Adineta vaga]